MASRPKPPNVAEAERRIDAFLRGEDRQIKLSALGLIEVPERLRLASLVESLRLDRNYLENLPNWLEDFQHLTYLSLYDNRFRSLPRCVPSLGTFKY